MSDVPIAPLETNPVARVRQMLRIADASSMSGSLGRLIMGLAVCLGAGFLFATMMAIFMAILFDKPWISWAGWLFIYLLIVVPLLIWHERMTRGNYLEDSAWAINPSSSSVGEEALHEFGVLVGMLTAWVLWGPRALIEGFRGVRGLRTWQKHAVFDRASILVLDLAKSQGGIEIKNLLYPPEDMQTFGQSVDLLETNGWIGKAGDGNSLWLNSTFRAKLRAAGL